MEQGDVLCVLFGGNVPYIIRTKDDESHNFIGECYTHGIMDGEALQYMNENDVQSFTLI